MPDDVSILSTPIYQGEGKWFKFTFTRDGVAVNLSTATFAFSIKANLDDITYVYQAVPGAFDTSLLATGIVRANLPAVTTSGMAAGSYIGELVTILTAGSDIDKKLVKFQVKKAVTP